MSQVKNKPSITKGYKMPSDRSELPFGPSTEAGILLEPNSGWRVERPVVDHEKCIKCLQCWVFCPEGVIDRDINIDMDFCKGCGVCANECPKQAITMVKEAGL